MQIESVRFIYFAISEVFDFSGFNWGFSFVKSRDVFNVDELGLEILSIALPATLALAADPITSLVDTAFVGHIGTLPFHFPLSKIFCFQSNRILDLLISFAFCSFALGSVELAAVGVSVSVFNLVSKLFNVPLLNITTSFVAEEQALGSKGNDDGNNN